MVMVQQTSLCVGQFRAAEAGMQKAISNVPVLDI
jgi:hypothetical protein